MAKNMVTEIKILYRWIFNFKVRFSFITKERKQHLFDANSEYQNKNSMENYLNTLVRYRRSVQQQDAESWYDDSSEEYVPDTQTFDYPDVDYSGKIV